MSGFWWGMLCIVTGVAWVEFTECAPWIAKKIVRAAVKVMPESQKARAAEEWAGMLEETPGKLWKILTACSLWWGVSREQLRRRLNVRALDMSIRLTDIFAALVFFLLFFPIYGLIALAVRISMGGPVLYSQIRFGKDGKPFNFYKFRSMSVNADQVLAEYLNGSDVGCTAGESLENLKVDPRITPLGRFIRALSLDELPQFWNVLRGDMSLIGPRPCMKHQQSLYGAHWADYCQVKPGITGLWQVSGRNRLSYAQRVELDVHYVRNRSLTMNFKILMKTATAVIRGDGSR